MNERASDAVIAMIPARGGRFGGWRVASWLGLVWSLGLFMSGAAVLAQPAVNVVTATIGVGEIRQRLPFSGEVRPIEETLVTADIQGRVRQIRVENGVAVKAGDPLIELEPERYQIAVWQEDAALEQARQKLRESERDFNRVKVLFEKQVTNERAYDAAETALVNARATVKLREAALALAKLNLKRCTIRARINGFFVNRDVFVGQLVGQGSALGRVIALDRVHIETRIAESDIGSLAVGRPAELVSGAAGRIAFIDLYADSSRSFLVKIEVPNRDQALKARMFVKGELVLAHHREVPLVPLSAIVTDERGEPAVFVVDGDRARRRRVRVIAREGAFAYVSDVAVGETVVTIGQAQLSDGTRIVVREAAAAGTGSGTGPAPAPVASAPLGLGRSEPGEGEPAVRGAEFDR